MQGDQDDRDHTPIGQGLMAGLALRAAVATGVFCAIFALTLSFVAPQLSMTQLIVASFISGFPGSLFARFALGK